jgi:hypothetical protein
LVEQEVEEQQEVVEDREELARLKEVEDMALVLTE